MKKIIKKSIEEIKLSNSQKEQIFYKITNKKDFNLKFLYKYAYLSVIVFMCVITLNLNDITIENEVMIITRENKEYTELSYEKETFVNEGYINHSQYILNENNLLL